MTPWHLRIPHFEHQHRFKNLVDLHDLSWRWAHLSEIKLDSHHPSLKALKSIRSDLWMLDLLPQAQLESYLIELHPEEVLSRLEKIVWITQSWLLQHLLEMHTQKESPILSTLEQESWRAGKECALRRWSPFLMKRKKPSLSEVALAFSNSPFSHYPHGDPFQVQRATSSHAWLTRQSCPHTSHHPEVLEKADELCSLHTHAMKGFAFSLRPSLQIEVPDPQRPCIQRWHLHETDESN